jgi:hypothetical protein
VAPPTPEQLRRREQVESLIRIMAPALNVVLAVGERISKLAGPEDVEYYPPRAAHEEPARRRPQAPAES